MDKPRIVFEGEQSDGGSVFKRGDPGVLAMVSLFSASSPVSMR
jgi:hypothetical protein